MTERFTLLSELGRGGMGVVWKARDEETGQIVALKLLREAYAEDPEYLARFERELELARRIDSAHVVKVLGFGIRKKVPYLALEYVDGPSLHDALAKHGPYSWPEARALLIQLAQGLADANAAGVIHRDVKSSNVLIGPDGVAKLTDFGIARGIDTTRMTATSTMLGTPAYLAPEGPKDARSDLYSLGIIGYQLLTGAVPFKGTSHQEVIFEHVRTPPDLSRLPTESRRIIGMLLAKDPSERPQRASVLLTILDADSLDPAAQTPVVQTSPPQPVVVAAPPPQRVPAQWTPPPPPAYSPGQPIYPPAWGGQGWAPSRRPAPYRQDSIAPGWPRATPPNTANRNSTPVVAGLVAIGLAICIAVVASFGAFQSSPSAHSATDAPLAALSTDTPAPPPTDTPTLKPTPTPRPTATPIPTPTPRYPVPTPGRFMYDLAPMLTPSQVDSINAAAVSFSAQHHCNIWLVTESLGSAAQVTSARAQADEQEILREWGTGCDIAVVFLADDARTTWWWREGSSGLPALPADFATQLNGVPKDDFGKWYVADGFIAIINKFGQALP